MFSTKLYDRLKYIISKATGCVSCIKLIYISDEKNSWEKSKVFAKRCPNKYPIYIYIYIYIYI